MRVSLATRLGSSQQTPTEHALARAVWLFAPGAIVGLELAGTVFGVDERTDARALLLAIGVGLAATVPVFFVLRRRRAHALEAGDASGR
ncbi:MAG: hypothetical protein IT377_10100 [Polyangiaceae bacterium]|nr:hypothetical protein [Polyangiaceae bacterium]